MRTVTNALFSVAFFLALFALPYRFAYALSCTAAADGMWNTIGTWSCGRVPIANDDVTINSSVTVTQDVNTAVLNTLTVNGTLNTRSSSTDWSLSVKNLTIGATGTLIANGSTITLSGTTGTLFTNSGTFTSGTSTVTIPGGGTAVNSGGLTGSNRLYNLTFNNVGTKTLGANIEVANVTTVTLGTLDTNSTGNYNLTTGSIVLANSSSAGLTVQAGSTLTLTATSGTLFTKNTNAVTSFVAGSTVRVTSDGDVTFLSGATSFRNVVFAPTLTGTNRTYTIGSTPTVNASTMTINPSGSGTLTVALSATTNFGTLAALVVQATGGASAKFDTTSSNYAMTMGTLSLGSGGEFSANASAITMIGSSTFLSLTGSGVFTRGTSTITISSASSVNLNTAGFTGSNKLYNLSLTNVGTRTLGGDLELEGTLSISNGTVDTNASGNYALTAGYISIANLSNSILNARASTITLNGTSGTLFTKGAAGTFTQGTSTVVVANPSGSPSLLSVAATFYIIKIASGSIVNLGANLTTSNTAGNMLWLSSGVFNQENRTVTPGLTATLRIDSGATYCFAGTTGSTTTDCASGATQTVATFPSFTTKTIDANSNIILLLDAALSVPSLSYGNIKFAPKMTASRTYTLPSSFSVAGNFSVTPSASSAGLAFVANMASGGATVTGTTLVQPDLTNTPTALLDSTASNYNLSTGKLDLESGGTLDIRSSTLTVTGTSGTLITNNGTFTAASGSTTTVSGNGSATFNTGSTITFGALTFTGTGTKTLGAGISIPATKAVTVSAGTIEPGSNTITASNSSNTLSVASGATINVGASTFAGNYSNFTTVTLSSGSTVDYNRAGAQTVLDSVSPYSNLIISGSGTKTLGGAITVDSSLTVGASSTLDTSSGNNYQITLKGNFTNNGTFTARSGTLLLSGTSQQTMTGNFTTTSALYNITITNSSGSDASDNERTGFVASVVFAGSLTSTNNYTIVTPSVRIEYNNGSTYTFNNINWNGQASGTKIYFRNSVASGTWLMSVTGTQTSVAFINVSRSDASGGNTVSAAGTVTDAGNNTNWSFGSVVVSGTASGNNGATVKIAVGGLVSASTGTISGGAWTISLTGPASADAIIVVWVDGVTDANESTAITKYGAGDVSGMVLDAGVLTIGSDQDTSLSITDLSSYMSSDDEDVMQSVSGGTLSVQGAGNTYTNPTLSILSGDTLAVGNTEGVTTGLLSVAGTLTSTGNAAYTLNGTSGTLFTRTGTFTPATSTVTLSGNGDATINSGTVTFYNLTSSGTGVKSTHATNAITIGSGGILTVSAGTFDPVTALVASGSNTLTVSGIIRVEASTFAGSYPAGFATVNLNSGSTVDYHASGTQTISSSVSPYYNLTVSTGGTKTLGGNMTVSNVATVGSGATLAGGTYTLTLSGTDGTPLVNGGTFSAGTGTVSFTGNNAGGNTSVPGETYYGLTVNNASETFALEGSTTISVGGALIVSAGTFEIGTHDFSNSGTTSISGTFSDSSATGSTAFGGLVTINSGGIWSTSGNPAFTFRGGLTNDSSSGFTSGSGTYTFDTSAQTVGGSQSYTITTISNAVTSGSGLTFSGQYPTVGTLTQGSDAVLTFGGTVPTITTLTANTSGNTVAYTATSAQTVKPATYYNLTKIGAGGTATQGGSVTVNNVMTVTSGTFATGDNALSVSDMSIGASGTLQGGSSLITVGENWINSGTFTAGTSEVKFNTGTTALVSGATTFYDLTITHTAAKQVNFSTTGSHIIIVSRFFIAEGHSGALIKLYSNSAGTKWHFKPTSTATVSYVDVKDGGCETGSITMVPFASTDSGNNDACWGFFSMPHYTYKLSSANTVEIYGADTATPVKTVQLPGDYNSIQPLSIAVDPVFGKLYVTTTDSSAELQIIDATSPSVSSWAYSSSVDLSISGNTGVTAKDVAVDSSGTVIVLGATSSTGGLLYIDTAGNTVQKLYTVASATDLVFGIYEYSGTYDGRPTTGYAYVYNANTEKLYAHPYFSDGVTLRVDESPNILAGYESPVALVAHMTSSGSLYLLFAAAPHTVYFFPVASLAPENITLIPSGSAAIGVTINDIMATRVSSNDHAYLATSGGLYKIADFSSPSAVQTDAVPAGLSSAVYDSSVGEVRAVSSANSTLYSFTP